MNPTKPFPNQFHRILVIRLSNFIGDMVVMTPVLSALRKQYPLARIAALADMPGAELLQGHPHIDELIVYRQLGRYQQRIRSKLSEHLAVWRSVRRGRFDLAINLHPGERAAVAAKLSGARIRVGFTRPPYSDFIYRQVYNHLVPLGTSNRNASDHLLDAVRAIGVAADSLRTSLGISISEALKAKQTLSRLQHPILGVHTGSGDYHKHWTAAGWMQLLNDFHCCSNASVVFLGSKTESAFVQSIQTNLQGPSLDLTGKLSLKETAAVAKETDVFAAIDSAVLHIAAAVGCPTVALFGPTDHVRWNPAGDDHVVVQADYPACGTEGCCNQIPSPCMRQIRPADALQAIQKVFPTPALTRELTLHSTK